jgi:hypothetical protein
MERKIFSMEDFWWGGTFFVKPKGSSGFGWIAPLEAGSWKWKEMERWTMGEGGWQQKYSLVFFSHFPFEMELFWMGHGTEVEKVE